MAYYCEYLAHASVIKLPDVNHVLLNKKGAIVEQLCNQNKSKQYYCYSKSVMVCKVGHIRSTSTFQGAVKITHCYWCQYYIR